MSLKARLLGGWIGHPLLRELLVENIRDLGTHFRRIELRASWLAESPHVTLSA